MAQQNLGVPGDDLEFLMRGVAGLDGGDQLLHQPQDERQRRAQLVADVGEELALQLVELPGPLVEFGELGVGVLELAAGLGDLTRPGEDLPLLGGVGPLQAHVVGDVFHLVDDVAGVMTEIQYLPIDSDRLDAMRGQGADEFGNPWKPRVAERWEPLRCCLRIAPAGEDIALISYSPWTLPWTTPWAEARPGARPLPPLRGAT